MQNPDEANLRKVSAKLICELMHNNEKGQSTFSDLFGFSPSGGLVSLNPVPEPVFKLINNDPGVLSKMKCAENMTLWEKHWCFPKLNEAE